MPTADNTKKNMSEKPPQPKPKVPIWIDPRGISEKTRLKNIKLGQIFGI
jgi:hypothetical protein